MMIGLVISLLTIGAMLAIYKVAIEVSGNASRTATRDGQVSSAMLAAQIELQQAGYGISRAEGAPDETLLAMAAEGQPARVVWRFKEQIGAGDVCAGLSVVAASSADDPAPGVYWLPPAACASAASATWSAGQRQLLASAAAFAVPVDKEDNVLVEAGNLPLAGAVFKLDGDCTLPYAQQRLDVSSAYKQSPRLVLENQDGTETFFSACLSNIVTAVITPPATGQGAIAGGNP